MGVTELHQTAHHARDEPELPTADDTVVHGVVPPADHELSVAVLVTSTTPDGAEVAHLVEDYEVVLIVHDARTAARMLQGLEPAPVVPRADGPTALGPATATAGRSASVTTLFEEETFVLDEGHHVATWRGHTLPLTTRECEILGSLLASPGRVLSYRELFEHAWGTHYLGDPSLVHSALKRLRRKLRDAGADVTIDAVRGIGFRTC